MKSVLVLAALVALATAVSLPPKHQYETKEVDDEFVNKQKKIFQLLHHVNQAIPEAEYYKFGHSYDLEAKAEDFTNKKAYDEFWTYFHHGFLPKGLIFSVFYDKMREEAITLYHLFYYAKDFETFYKVASWARVHLNEGLFTYAFSVAVLHRADTKGIVLPAPYEVYPFFFVNSEVIEKAYAIKMQEGLLEPEVATYYGIVSHENEYAIYANYTGSLTWANEEQRLTYFTEDIGLNTYYYYFHVSFPFWMKGEEYGYLKERRGEVYYFYHQQLLARYYMERLTNGLGEIPDFSWDLPVKTGYYPNMFYRTGTPFTQRNNFYYLHNVHNDEKIEYLENYEKQFLQYLHEGKFHGYEGEVDLRKAKAVNFVGNYWQSNPDSRDKFAYKYNTQYYEIIARVLLGASPEPIHKYHIRPSPLEQFQTSLRDPVFWQLYKRIIYYFIQYKQYLEPYTKETLAFPDVKISDVKVDQLVTFYEYYDFDATNAVFYSKKEYPQSPYHFTFRQPRLNHKPFDFTIDVKSEVSTDAVFKIFLGPKYDSSGHVLTFENNWMNFVEMDWFVHKLNPGKNSIVRHSDEFFFYKADSIPSREIYKLLDSKKIPKDMTERFEAIPRRLMLPRGTSGGYPFQFYVVVYPYVPLVKEMEEYKRYFLDNKPLGYPLDRPVNDLYFYQPNMYLQDVFIYHEGTTHTYKFNIHPFVIPKNEVPTH